LFDWKALEAWYSPEALHVADIAKLLRGGTKLDLIEASRDQSYRNVINTVATLDQRIHAVQVKVPGDEHLTTLFPTPNHPFWVENKQTPDGQHWLATECLAPGMVLQLADGRKATVHANGLVRQTQHENIGFAGDDRSGVGIVVDLSGRRIALASDETSARCQQPGQTLKLGDPWLTPVYNFEVEDLHTYYVGDSAVWVHNTNCAADPAAARQAAIADTMRNAELGGTCFDEDTSVHVEEKNIAGVRLKSIRYLQVGDKVLSRCEKTGEMAYKRVTKVFEHGSARTYDITFKYGPEVNPELAKHSIIYVTGEHPFWVQGKGWVKVRDLQVGDVMSTENGMHAELASICESMTADNRHPIISNVWNIEVEDFHTYFVHWSGLWVHNKTKAEVSSLSLNKVEYASPEWTPLYKNAADLMAELEIKQPDPAKRAGMSEQTQLNEQALDRKLSTGEIRAAALPDGNFLNKDGIRGLKAIKDSPKQKSDWEKIRTPSLPNYEETIEWALSRVADWGQQLESEQDFFRHSRVGGNP